MKSDVFKIAVPEEILDDLKERLRRTRWADDMVLGWDGGTDPQYLRELVSYWLKHFDWRRQESRLNSFSHYRAEVEDQVIHFIHQRSSNPKALPLIITHGWPGSFVEMLQMIPMLSDHFHIVVPSLPGYGFSSKPKQPGMTPRRIAALWVKLMGQLGYNSFATQGGDWGATVSTWLGLDFPDRVSAIHLNYIPGSYRPFLAANAQLSEAEKQFQQDRDNWFQEEGGYGHIQSTKPNTVGFGLNDSPAGLAAWIVEKVRSWSDCDGDVEKRFSKDEILTNIQIYWVTGTIYSSMRLYQEAKKMPVHFGSDQKVRVRCAVARFPKEAPMPPRDWVERGYNVERWTEMKVGAHFAAWEEPALLAGDLIEFLA